MASLSIFLATSRKKLVYKIFHVNYSNTHTHVWQLSHMNTKANFSTSKSFFSFWQPKLQRRPCKKAPEKNYRNNFMSHMANLISSISHKSLRKNVNKSYFIEIDRKFPLFYLIDNLRKSFSYFQIYFNKSFIIFHTLKIFLIRKQNCSLE